MKPASVPADTRLVEEKLSLDALKKSMLLYFPKFLIWRNNLPIVKIYMTLRDQHSRTRLMGSVI